MCFAVDSSLQGLKCAQQRQQNVRQEAPLRWLRGDVLELEPGTPLRGSLCPDSGISGKFLAKTPSQGSVVERGSPSQTKYEEDFSRTFCYLACFRILKQNISTLVNFYLHGITKCQFLPPWQGAPTRWPRGDRDVLELESTTINVRSPRAFQSLRSFTHRRHEATGVDLPRVGQSTSPRMPACLLLVDS